MSNNIKDVIHNRFFFYLLLLILIASLLGYLDSKFLTQENLKDILVESHGLIFDIIVFGILFLIYDTARERRDDIKKHINEIDDLKGWWQEEAAIKIASRFKKLLSLKVNKSISLNNCYLAKQTFLSIKISNSDFKGSNLDDITFSYSTITDSDFEGCSLLRANFNFADISGCKFFKEAVLTEAILQAAKIERVQADNSYFLDCDFSSVKLDNESYKYPDERKEIIEKSYIKETDIKNNIITTVFSDAVLTNSRFDKAKFIEVKIFNTNFSGSSFKGASFLHSNIMKTKFIMADCTGAVFDNCRLEEIEISVDTNFQEASFIGAVIKGVNFKKAKLKGAKFSINFKPELERQGVDISELIFVD